MQETIVKKKPHTLSLNNRAELSLTGVIDVPGFDEQTIHIKLDGMSLIIKGERLHINKLSLDTGDVCIDGEINALQYTDIHASRSLRSKLFR